MVGLLLSTLAPLVSLVAADTCTGISGTEELNERCFPFKQTDPDDKSYGDQVLLLSAMTSYHAMCLDSTAPIYYWRKGTGEGTGKWHIHYEGNGWCQNLTDCKDRMKGKGGSNKAYLHVDKLALNMGYLSNDPAVNPMMHNWNVAFLRSCDGGFFLGNKSTADGSPQFQGKVIAWRMMGDLFAAGANQATEVVVSGFASGGVTVLQKIDEWAKALPQAKVRGLVEASFFVDWPIAKWFQDSLKYAYNNMGMADSVLSACLHSLAHPAQGWKCLMPPTVLPFVKTPIFFIQSAFDTWQTANILCDTDHAYINAFGSALRSQITPLLTGTPNGAYIHSCVQPCYALAPVVGLSSMKAFQTWYGGVQTFVEKEQDYPCPACCTQASNVAAERPEVIV
eukprot:TRINITY_DN62396_c0_g1_i1.p1 TRINITY_DN62396_c0_g1~~TRINITY_DN62396_c0_g1_i1.p1  ORF type:complete len:394 (-),score=57.59 TRINITY_DN62396_c0_g1_i1:47-1228(-)